MADYSKIKEILSQTPKSKKEAIECDRLERSITSYREEQLLENPIQGNYDFEHLAKIHHYIFHGLHDYAGKLRQIEPFYKQNGCDPSLVTIFADIEEILPTINETSIFLRQHNHLKDLKRDDFIYEFSVSYAEFNFAHPFEEGNGRATRILFKQLAKGAGYDFDTSQISKKEWDMASTLSCEHGVIYDMGDGKFEIEPDDSRDISALIAVMDKCLISINNHLELKELSESLATRKIKQNHPTISTIDAQKIELYRNYLMEHYPTLKAQYVALEKLYNSLPNIASGKIVLPDMPDLGNDKKDKGGR